MSTCSRETALFYPPRKRAYVVWNWAYFAGKLSKNRLVCKNAVALAYYGSCRLLVMGSYSWSEGFAWPVKNLNYQPIFVILPLFYVILRKCYVRDPWSSFYSVRGPCNLMLLFREAVRSVCKFWQQHALENVPAKLIKVGIFYELDNLDSHSVHFGIIKGLYHLKH